MHQAFEQAILDAPDERANYAAYADWLQEQNDPRGEFISVQLALEDPSRTTAERRSLRSAEKRLLRRHEATWLGSLAPHILRDESTDGPEVTHQWRFGFLQNLTAQYLPLNFAKALAYEPAARFLRELRIDFEAWYLSEVPSELPRTPKTPRNVGCHWELLELIDAPCLKTLRVFQMGSPEGEPPEDGWVDCHVGARGLEHVVAGMARVEELHLLCKDYDLDRLVALPNLTNLRVLRALHLGSHGSNQYRRRYEYPLNILAANRALANLERLEFHPHYREFHPQVHNYQPPLASFIPLKQVQALVKSSNLPRLTHLQLRLSNMGNDGVKAIIRSGILSRLTWLDLRHGCINDDGARLFAACPDSRHLAMLDLSRNAVSASGLALLKAAGIKAVANRPQTAEELAREEYLMEGDFE